MWKSLIITGAGALFLMSLSVLITIDRDAEDVPAFVKIPFETLAGWDKDVHGAALTSFQKSCAVLLSMPPDSKIKPEILGGLARDWHESCQAGMEVSSISNKVARRFFEEYFTVVSYRTDTEGLFTGYFAPEYSGSAMPSEEYNYPLYALPEDLQVLDLGDFSKALAGEKIIGEIKDGAFVPYKDRKLIDEGALEDQELELVWLKDPTDAFFLHIQGSGVIRYENGDRRLFGYAGKNGKAYHAIGKFLIESGEISREKMSMQAIRQWMRDNPMQAQALMWKNPSYVFFRPLSENAPVGAMNVPLTPGRSLAVDRNYVPLGMPVWLDLSPTTELADPIRRLVIAQDTGGAIKGRVRADVYWGVGADAGLMAGPMKDKGRYYFLVPKGREPHVLAIPDAAVKS
ncbi:murein transglycosylase A [Paremcibacter congregatus]|uniref:peptidoglycan lytic exotransglycosylase n=1 Tax=Paremcibacter congregatus TaxID=2043170 RepID=A0A2G4YPK6_9PROT|nr:MltA domain-containing protein [Paremcibacter congregatus]PHZ84253.1 murein transglycosylase [Paremcibacter congregatus]QDE29012.1 murein transglycosylase [Paremcibacter congregatus]